MTEETLSPNAMTFLEQWKQQGNSVTSQDIEDIKLGNFNSELGKAMLKAAGVYLD
jgi:hypothetical protein